MPKGFATLDLLDLDKDTKKAVLPPESRVSDVKVANNLYSTFVDDDENSAIARARIDAMFDGAPPYDPKVLASTGQGHRCNLNFGEGQRMLDTALAAYVDLINGVERLVSVHSTMGRPGEALRFDNIISEEVTRTFRSWGSFHSSYLRLVTQFIKHGVGVSYFADDKDWRFRACGLSDFLIPRHTVASEEAVEIAFARVDYMVHELYHFIKNPEMAEKRGWNPEEVKRVICTATREPRADLGVTDRWEELQARIKNNDILEGHQALKCSVVHCWVREMDGKVSHFLFSEKEPKEWMFKRVARFPTTDSAFIMFSYGAGNNGTYHAVRGLGQRVFAHVQASNRLRCQMVDGAAMASTIMLRAGTPRALDELSYAYWGPYSILGDNVDIIAKDTPDLTRSVIPAINDMSSQLRSSIDFYSHEGAAEGSPYRSQFQVRAELESAVRLASANLNLFYDAWHRLIREMTRRLVNGPSSDPAVTEFYRRLEDRGVPREVVKSIDHRKTFAVKAIGAGNASARAAAMADLQQLAPELSERGRVNLLYDRVATATSYEMAARYVDEPDTPEYSTERQLAAMENIIMAHGQMSPVHPDQMHETHLEEHLPYTTDILNGIEVGQLDPMVELPALRVRLEHISLHAQQLANSPSSSVVFSAAREVINNAGQVVTNMERKIMAEQRRAAEQGGQPQEGGGGGDEMAQAKAQQEMQLKAMAAELDRTIKLENAAIDRSIKMAKAAQDRAINAMKAAQQLGLAGPLDPGVPNLG